MFLIYFFAAAFAFFTIPEFIHSALLRRRSVSSGATGVIVDQTLGRTVGAWVIAGPVDVFGGNFLRGMTEYRFFYGQLPMYVFLIVVIVAATFNAIRWSRRLIRFGRSYIQFDPATAFVGRQFKGTLHIPRPLPTGAAVDLRLQCTRTSKSMSSGHAVTRNTIDYDQEQQSDSRSTLGCTGPIPFEFTIGDNESPTTPLHKLGFFQIGYVWTLSALSTTPGIDYWSKFEAQISTQTIAGLQHGEPLPVR